MKAFWPITFMLSRRWIQFRDLQWGVIFCHAGGFIWWEIQQSLWCQRQSGKAFISCLSPVWNSLHISCHIPTHTMSAWLIGGRINTTISSFRLHLRFENAALLFHFFPLRPVSPPLISQGHFSKLCLFKALDHFNPISPEMRKKKDILTIYYLMPYYQLSWTKCCPLQNLWVCVCARMWRLCQCLHEKDSDKEP